MVTLATSNASVLREDSVPDSQACKINWKEAANRSTIYKRHQARLLKSMEKADDPRPKMVRVMAGLPGFRIFMASKDSPTQTPFIRNTESVSADATVKTMQSSKAESSLASLGQPLHVIMTVGTLGALAESFYGNKHETATRTPFRNASPSTSGRLLHEHGSFSLFRQHSASLNAAISSHATRAQLLAGASTASVLFGGKLVLTNFWSNGDNHEESTKPAFVASMATSALTGLFVGVARAMQMGECSVLAQPTTLAWQEMASNNLLWQHQQRLLARHVLGASLYFASYDMVQSRLRQEQQQVEGHPSIAIVVVSGALAGAMYQTSLLSFQTRAGSSSMLLSSAPPTLLSAVLRAAPVHATLFLAYEWSTQKPTY